MAESHNLPMPNSPVSTESQNGSYENDLSGPNGSSGVGGVFDQIGVQAVNMIAAKVQSFVPRHWSRSRDQFLYDMYKYTPEVKIGIGVAVRHVTSIVPTVVPRDQGDETAMMAATLQNFILRKYWGQVRRAWRDFCVFDSGGYLEVLSFYEADDEDTVTRSDGTILIGALKPWQVPGSDGVWLSAAGFKAHDPRTCIPTADEEYPVMVQGKDGKRYALHHTRVIRIVNSPSSDADLNGIGFSYLSLAIEEAGQVYHAQTQQSRNLEGKPTPSILFVSPWDGADVQAQMAAAYQAVGHMASQQGKDAIIPISVVGMADDFHQKNNGLATDFKVEQLMLQRLPEGYERKEWSDSLLRKFSVITGIPTKFFGIEQKFSSRQDSESQSDSMHNVGASEFTQFLNGDLQSSFCTINTCMSVQYNDEVLVKREAEVNRERAETYEVLLGSGASDLEGVLDQRIANGEIEEEDKDRILQNAESSQQAPPEPDAKATLVVTDHNRALAELGADLHLWDEPAEDPEVRVKSAESYGRQLRSTIRQVWKGEIDNEAAEDELILLVGKFMRESAHRAARSVGVQPSELTDEENAVINDTIDLHFDSAASIVKQASDGSQANGGKLGPLLKRLEMWENTYRRLYDEMLITVGQNVKLKWGLGATDHCSDCLKLEGKVYRANRWKELGISPKSTKLECGGFRCGCSYSQTDDPVSRGRFPKLSRGA